MKNLEKYLEIGNNFSKASEYVEYATVQKQVLNELFNIIPNHKFESVLELGCGKGEYSVGLAEKFPDKNFIGIDLKGARFWRGAKTAVENGLKNVAFIRTQIELIDLLFNEKEMNKIY